jgi:hypothetical protein
MIAHYSAVSRRTDMPTVRRQPGGGLYFLPPHFAAQGDPPATAASATRPSGWLFGKRNRVRGISS